MWRQIKKPYVIALLLLGLVALGGFLLTPVHHAGSSPVRKAATPQAPATLYSHPGRQVPFYSVATNKKIVAVSFDSCYGDNYTLQLLDTLKKHHVRATFFLTGLWVQKYPTMVKKIASDGMDIGNHSNTHPHMKILTSTAMKKQISDTDTLIYKLTGTHPRLFRCPYGEYNNNLMKTANSLNYQVIQWSLDSLDWQGYGSAKEIDRVMKNVKPGAIILFHNNARYTPQALPVILDRLGKQGYRIVSVSDLLIKNNYYIDTATGEQKKIPAH
jgi:polysaccharide deacetylase family sporulation protein PdaB